MPETSELIGILDDDASVRNSIERLLDSDGFATKTFERAADFLAYATEHNLRLAVLDVWLPEASGLAVQQQLRKVSPETRVIVMTGREQPGIRVSAMSAGAFSFLVKPFDDEDFLAVVRRALNRSEPNSPKVP